MTLTIVTTEELSFKLDYGNLESVHITPRGNLWRWEIVVSDRLWAQGTSNSFWGALEKVRQMTEPWQGNDGKTF